MSETITKNLTGQQWLESLRPDKIYTPEEADRLTRSGTPPKVAVWNDHDAPIQMRLPLFDESRLPYKPYCSDEKCEGNLYLKIRPMAQALRKPYIQINPPTLKFWLCFDLDHANSWNTWELKGLAPPAWCAVSRESGHGHYAYALSAPVLTSDVARQAPLRYLAAIESAYREKLGGDPGFSGLVTKNPSHVMWNVLQGPQRMWELGELAAYIPNIKKHVTYKRSGNERVGIERNIALFETLRHWAYRHIRQFKGAPQGFVHWQNATYSQAKHINGDFATPLWDNEAWHVAKSVSKWTWTRFDLDASDKRFSEKQAVRGRMGGLAKGAANADMHATACLMRSKGMSYRAIGEELGFDHKTISAWCSEVGK